MLQSACAKEYDLKILFLSQYFYPEQFLNNHVARALAAEGHQVDVVCCVPNYPAGRFFDGYSNHRKKEEFWEGVRVHRVFTVPRGKSSAQLLLNYLVYPVAASWRLLWLKPSSDAISFVSMPSPLFQALAGIFAKRIWRIPTVYWVQDIWPDSAIITMGIKNRIVIGILNSICGWIYRQADLICAQNDGFHDTIAAFGVPRSKIVTLPNCAPDTFGPITSEDIPPDIRGMIPDNRRIFMFAGNIGESQDFDTIIKAAALLPEHDNPLVVVIGSGRDEGRVKDKVAAAGLEARFLFLGRHPEHQMPAFFACADVMLVTLRNEPIFALTVPSKLQAYMACGKPILGSLDGVGAEIVTGCRAGIAVAASSPALLAEAMNEFSAMSDDALNAMGLSARAAYQEHYSLRAVTDKLTHHLQLVQRGPEHLSE